MITRKFTKHRAINFKNTEKYKSGRGKTVYFPTTQKEQLSTFWLIFLQVFHFLFNVYRIIYIISCLLFNTSHM